MYNSLRGNKYFGQQLYKFEQYRLLGYSFYWFCWRHPDPKLHPKKWRFVWQMHCHPKIPRLHSLLDCWGLHRMQWSSSLRIQFGYIKLPSCNWLLPEFKLHPRIMLIGDDRLPGMHILNNLHIMRYFPELPGSGWPVWGSKWILSGCKLNPSEMQYTRLLPMFVSNSMHQLLISHKLRDGCQWRLCMWC